jgi:hypothetical protein
MLGKLVLWVSTIAFVSYGVACLVSPTLPAEFAGLGMLNGNGYAEVGAMYGGLQTGFGLFCLLAALKSEFYRSGLVALVMVIGALAIGRLVSTFAAPEGLTFYTWGALGYEFATAIIAGIALQQSQSNA